MKTNDPRAMLPRRATLLARLALLLAATRAATTSGTVVGKGDGNARQTTSPTGRSVETV